MKVTYNGIEKKVKKGEKVVDIFNEEIKQSKYDVLACKFNNEVRSLNYEITKSGKVEFIDYTSTEGKRIYTRGLMYILAMACEELYPELFMNVRYQLNNAMYCSVDNEKVNREKLKDITERMQEIINSNIPIRKVIMSKKEAEDFYKNNDTKKGRLQLDSKPTVSLYYCNDYFNYFYGVMPISTGYMKIFELTKYQDGFLVRYPKKESPEKLSKFIETKKLRKTLDEYEDIHKALNVITVDQLNKQVEYDGAKDCILVDEALHEKKLAELADKIKNKKGVKVVLIAGPSSSGKTTFAHRLGIHLRINGLRTVTLSVDNYFVERKDTPKDENGKYDFECIEALDLKLFNDHLLRLINGEEVEIPDFDFKVGTKRYNGNKIKLEKNDILVVEGIHCLNEKLTAKIPASQKYKIYISALTVLNLDDFNRISTTDTRLIRRIVRDHQYRGYSAEHTLSTWYSVNRGEQKNIYPYQEEADAMFNSSLIYELGVLKDYAMPLLEKIDRKSEQYAEARRLITLLQYFKSIKTEEIPESSLIREFVGHINESGFKH